MPSPNYLSMFGFGSGIPYGQKAGLPGAPQASPGNIQGSNPQSGAGPYGGLPQVPNPITNAGQNYQGNTGNLGNLNTLGTGLNTQIANQAAIPYNLNLPQYQGMIGQSSGNILSLLKGQVPQDVANQISQMAAERGVSTGSIGSPNANTALLRSLGLTSLGLQGQGEQELTGAVGRTPTGQQFNPASFLVSPQQSQEAQYLSNLFAASPDPSAAAFAQLQNFGAGLGFGLGGRGYQQPNFNPYTGGGTQGAPPPYSGGQQPLGAGQNIGGPQYGTPGSFNAPPPTYGGSQQYGPIEPYGPPDTGNLSPGNPYFPQGSPGSINYGQYGPDQGGMSGFPTGPESNMNWQAGMPYNDYQQPDFFSGDLFGDFGGG